MHDRHALNAFLKESGFGTSGDLVYLEPARSRTMEVRRSEKAVVATISTAARDRHGDVIDPKGVRLERFRKNPVVLYAHDYEGLPVARSLWERVRDGDSGPELVAKPQFHMDTELSREVWALVEKGVLSAWSVGFIPEEWEPIRPDHQGTKSNKEGGTEAGRTADRTRVGGDVCRDHGDLGALVVKAAGGAGFRVRKWDLLEYSCVPVAANFEALTRELESRRITAPALVKSLAPLGMRQPDLVPQPVRLDHQDTKDAKEVEGNGTSDSPGRETDSAAPAALGALVVDDVVARGFDLWLSRARGGTRS